jgi:hypothetical protein
MQTINLNRYQVRLNGELIFRTSEQKYALDYYFKALRRNPDKAVTVWDSRTGLPLKTEPDFSPGMLQEATRVYHQWATDGGGQTLHNRLSDLVRCLGGDVDRNAELLYRAIYPSEAFCEECGERIEDGEHVCAECAAEDAAVEARVDRALEEE